MKGYKIFKVDWTCKGVQYEVGKTFKNNRIYFKENLKDIASPLFNDENYFKEFFKVFKIAEIEVIGTVTSSCYTNEIHINKELTQQEVLTFINTEKNCTSYWNTGNWNTGGCNTGNRNTSDWNTGDCNIGEWNAGDCNIGNWNTGDSNTGNQNTGECNAGSWNTGECNAGNRNTGDWNISDYNTGCFCTDEHEILIFDKPSGMSYEGWLNSDARYLLNQMPKNFTKWIFMKDMTDKEKQQHPEYKTTGGYLKVIDKSKCGQIWWNKLSDRKKEVIKAIPNFDAVKFKKCTGITVD